MTNRSPILVLLLGVLTFGLYSVYWMWTTTTEMNERGAIEVGKHGEGDHADAAAAVVGDHPVVAEVPHLGDRVHE